MSERVVVPELIVKRVHLRLREWNGYPHPDSKDSKRLLELAEVVCGEFANALSEHPIVPTNGQVQAMQIYFHERTPDHSPTLLIVEWQRRMFRAPGAQPQSFDTPFGRFIVDTRVPPGEIRLENWNGPTLLRCAPPEPEAEPKTCKHCGQPLCKGVSPEHPFAHRNPYRLNCYMGEPWTTPEPEVPEAVDPIEFLFEELLNLAQYVGPLEKDTIGHIRQELERYRRGLRGKP